MPDADAYLPDHAHDVSRQHLRNLPEQKAEQGEVGALGVGAGVGGDDRDARAVDEGLLPGDTGDVDARAACIAPPKRVRQAQTTERRVLVCKSSIRWFGKGAGVRTGGEGGEGGGGVGSADRDDEVGIARRVSTAAAAAA